MSLLWEAGPASSLQEEGGGVQGNLEEGFSMMKISGPDQVCRVMEPIERGPRLVLEVLSMSLWKDRETCGTCGRKKGKRCPSYGRISLATRIEVFLFGCDRWWNL